MSFVLFKALQWLPSTLGVKVQLLPVAQILPPYGILLVEKLVNTRRTWRGE